jgi:aminomethyltransferase
MDVDLANLATTPLHDWHRAHGGRLVEFAGWSMPVQYASIVAEHLATRNQAALFDVSHMGRFQLQGSGAARWLNGLTTRRVDDLPPGRIRYSLVTRDDGGVLDDVLVYHLLHPTGDSHFWIVVNASNRVKIWNWFKAHGASDNSLSLTDQTHSTAMIAVQGPLACRLVQHELGLPDLESLRNYRGRAIMHDERTMLYSRTGYTGEDGVELIVAAEQSVAIWQRLLKVGASQGVVAAGLGARDTLRLEAGMPLYGHELSESRLPIHADLDFALDLDGRNFPGSAALVGARQRGDLPWRVGLMVEGKRVARQGSAIFDLKGTPAGEVTSGTYSPTLERSIAMAYVPSTWATVGTSLQVDIRGKRTPAEIVRLPFYRRA